MKNNVFLAIKIVSTVLISGAIALELLNIQMGIHGVHLPKMLTPLFLIGRGAMLIHLAEGVIAAYYAPYRQRKWLAYGTYTFFVGTVGLFELFEPADERQ